VKVFQKRSKIKATGVVDNTTWTVLSATVARV
jgi:hypothetical protein